MSRSLGSLTLDLIAKTANFTGPMDKASANYKRNANEINKSSELISRGVIAAGAAIAGAISVSALTSYADGWTDLQSRVVAATGSQQSARDTMRELFGVARNTYSAFGQTNEIFLANSKTMEELGYRTQKQTEFASALNNALVAGATKGQAAESVVKALSDSFVLGSLQGDQFKSVVTNGGRVAQALADSLGVTTIELRKMASEGLLTTSKVIDGLISQLPRLADEASKMPATVSDGLLLINNSTSLLIGTLDQSIMTTGALADVLVGIADGMSDFALSLDAVDIVTGIELAKDAAIILAGVLVARLMPAVAKKTLSMHASTVAYIAATKESYRYQVALAGVAGASTRAAAAQTAMAVALKAGNAAMALVGGPLGVAVLAGAAIYMFANRLNENERALKAIEGPLDAAIAKYREMGDLAREAAMTGLSDQIRKDEAALKAWQLQLDGYRTFMSTSGQVRGGYSEVSEKRQKEIRLEMEKLNDTLDENRKKYAALSEVASRGLLRVSDALDKYIDANNHFGFSTEAVVAGVVSDYEKLNQQMLKRIALYGNESQAAELLYDIQNGLIKLNPGQDVLLLASAKRLDALTAETKAAKETADAYKQLKGDFQGIADRLDPGTAALNRFNKERGVLFSALDKGIIDLQRFDDLMTSLNGEFADSLLIDVDAIGSGLKGVEDIYTGMFERISGSGADVIVNWLSGAKDALGGLKDMAIRTIAEIANEALLTPIVLNVQQSMTGKPVESASGGGIGSAIGAMGMGGIWAAVAVAVVAGVNEHNKNEASKYEHLTAEIRQGVQSTGTLLGMANAKSESIANLLGSMDERYKEVLNVNHSINRVLMDIRTGLAGVAAGFARTVGYNPAMQIQTGSSSWVDPRYVSGESLNNYLNGFVEISTPVYDFVLSFLGGLGDKVTKEIFKKKVSVLDSGIQIVGAGLADILATGAIEAFSYADVETKKKFFGVTTSTKLKTETESLGALFESQLADVFGGAADALKISSGTYGIDFDQFINQLVVDPIKLSLKDLEGDEITAEIERFLSSTMDGWAGVLLGGTDVLDRYQQVGEGAFETMVRISTQTEQFTQQLGFVGLELGLTGVAAVKAVQDIAALSGGFDTLSGSLSVYYDKFFTDAEKFENLTAQLAGATGGILDSLPETTAQFRDIISAIDNTTEAGQKQFAALINLSGPMYEYIKGLGDQAKVQRDAVAALDDYLKPFLQTVTDYGLSDFEKSVAALSRTFDGNILRAKELGASEQQLAAIRAAANIDMQAILVSQTDAAMDRLNSSIVRQIEMLGAETQAGIAVARSDYDARVVSLNGWLDTQLSHYQRRAATLANSIADLTSLSNSLANAADALRPVTEAGQQMAYSAALSNLSAIAAGVSAGGALPAAGLIDTLTASLSGGDRYYSNFADYAIATAGALANIDSLAGVTEKQLTADEKLLAAVERSEQSARDNHARMLGRMQTDLDAQIAAMNEQQAVAVEALEQQRKDAEERIAAMRGIDTTLYSVEQTMQQVRDAINAEARQREQTSAQVNAQQLDQLRLLVRNTADMTDEINRLRMNLEGAA